MRKMTILSGKGGTGKTTITASFAALSRDAVLADCDVDASNLHLLLKPEVKETIEFKGLNLAVIDPRKCIQCGLCEEKCRFGAINDFEVDSIHCEGCKVCVQICPVQAIDFVERICGHAYISETKYGPMSHARLIPGMENSGKLVTLVRQNAKRLAEEGEFELVLVDGPPGIGCPVIASLSDIDKGLVVDGVGGTIGGPGFLTLGGMDGELSYLLRGFSKGTLFQGGVLSLLEDPTLSPEAFAEKVDKGETKAVEAWNAVAEGLVKAVALPRDNFCLACFTGDYPIPVQLEMDKLAMETMPADYRSPFGVTQR